MHTQQSGGTAGPKVFAPANKTLTYLVYIKNRRRETRAVRNPKSFLPCSPTWCELFPFCCPLLATQVFCTTSEQRIIIRLHNYRTVQYGCRSPLPLLLPLSALSRPTNQALLHSQVIYVKCNSPETEVSLPVLLALLLQLLHMEKRPLQNTSGFSASNSNREDFKTAKRLLPKFAGASWPQEPN